MGEIADARDIYGIDATSIEDSGGGVHCVTNDQPADLK